MELLVDMMRAVQIIGAGLCGIALGVALGYGWLVWYFRDVMK